MVYIIAIRPTNDFETDINITTLPARKRRRLRLSYYTDTAAATRSKFKKQYVESPETYFPHDNQPSHQFPPFLTNFKSPVVNYYPITSIINAPHHQNMYKSPQELQIHGPPPTNPGPALPNLYPPKRRRSQQAHGLLHRPVSR